MKLPVKKLAYSGLMLAVGLNLSSCHKSSNASAGSTKPVAAPEDLAASLTPDGDNLKLKQNALGKMFLLRSQVKVVGNTPTWDDQKPLVVVFQTNGAELAMFSLNSFATYNVIDSKSLVASFKIVSATDEDITFSWGGGAKFVNNESITDADGGQTITQEQAGLSSEVSVISSFVESSSISDNLLHVREDDTIAVLTNNPAVGTTPASQSQNQQDIVVDYRLEPYKANPQFKATEADPFHHFGFFVTDVAIPQKSAAAQSLAMHWDMNPARGPITYAISKYFPASIKQAVKEGVLYWNNVLGPNSVQVVMDVDPEQDFPDRTVVVNWLPWNDAAASWAGLAADPMTGEVINGKIYITSVFLQLDSVYAFAKTAPATPKLRLALAGSGSTSNCNFPASEISKAMALLPTGSVDRQTYVNDSIRYVVAHESGHTLGLRHNFAGSYDSPLNATQINAEKLKYIADPSYVGAEVSTSVMDYIGSFEQGMTGRWVLNHALKYDVAALKWGSNPDQNVAEESALKFCTDEDVGASNLNNGIVLYGCDRFDAAANPLNIGSVELKVAFGSSVERLFFRIVDALKTSDPNATPSIDTILNQDFAANSGMLSPAADIKAQWPQILIYASATGAGTVHSPVNFESKMPQNWDFDSSTLPTVDTLLAKDMTEVGGIANLARTFLPYNANGKLNSTMYKDQLVAFLATKEIASGTTLNGTTYNLSQTEQQKVLKYLATSALSANEQLFFGIVPAMNLMLTSSQWVGGFTLAEANDLVSLATDLTFWQVDSMQGSVQGKAITLPVYVGSPGQRALAAQIGTPKVLNVNILPANAMTDYKQSVTNGVGAELGAVYSELKLAATDPQMPASLKTSAEHAAFITALADKGLISTEVQLWAQDEIALLAAVEAQ